MTKDGSQQNSEKKRDDCKKRIYQKPQILSVEKLEIVAAACDPGTHKGSETINGSCEFFANS